VKVIFRYKDNQGIIHNEWMDRTELIEKKPEFFEDQKPFLHPHFVLIFQEMLDEKAERVTNKLL